MGTRLMPMEWSLHGNEAHANGVGLGNEAHANGVEPAWERGSCQWSGACMGMRLMPMEWGLGMRLMLMEPRNTNVQTTHTHAN